MVVTTIALEESLHRRLALAAVEERAALTELVREAVREWLERRDRTRTGRRGQ
jgi:predicted HicB family RNase H-like nuclease